MARAYEGMLLCASVARQVNPASEFGVNEERLESIRRRAGICLKLLNEGEAAATVSQQIRIHFLQHAMQRFWTRLPAHL